MRVIIKKPNGYHEVANIKGDLKELQEIVGGYIEIPFISRKLSQHGIDTIINDEGKLQGLPINIHIVSDEMELVEILVGNVIFASHDDEGDTIGLNDDQIKVLDEHIKYAQWEKSDATLLSLVEI